MDAEEKRSSMGRQKAASLFLVEFWRANGFSIVLAFDWRRNVTIKAH